MHRFTLGVEEEFQIVDPQTWELRSHVTRAARDVGPGARRSDQAGAAPVDRRGRHAHLRGRRGAARRDLPHPRTSWCSAAERAGLAVAAAGTHPFSHWKDQVLSPGVRYDSIVEELQQLARSLLIFGLHVHVAVPDRTTMIDLMNEVALLPAAPAGALDQLAVLDGARHRPEVVPHDDLPALSAHRRARPLRLVERIRELRQAARRPALHRRRRRRSGGTCGRIRRSGRSSSASATCRRDRKSR